MAKNPPTIRMRRLGTELRKVREARGLDLEEAAALVNMSKSALSRMENAQVVVRRHEVDYLLIKYDVTDETLCRSIRGLAGAGRSKEWVKRHGDLVGSAGEFVRLEQDSAVIRELQPVVINGLLQTPEYCRAVMVSAGDKDADRLERAVAFRMARKEVLTRMPPARLEVVLGEGVLRQMLGGVEVMQGQLRYLLEASTKPNISLQILPFSAAKNPGVDGACTLLDVEAGLFTVVVTESIGRSTFLEGDDDVARHSAAFNMARALALSEADSRALIKSILRELENSQGQESG